MIETYLHRFANLRTDKARNRYSALTLHRAPHKPFLLLSVMDLIAQGAIAENFIEPSYELVDTFNLYWTQIMPPGSRTSMAYPFPCLKTDGFWCLIQNPGYCQFSILCDFKDVLSVIDEKISNLECPILALIDIWFDILINR